MNFFMHNHCTISTIRFYTVDQLQAPRRGGPYDQRHRRLAGGLRHRHRALQRSIQSVDWVGYPASQCN